MNLFEWLSITLFMLELGLLIFICWEGWETLKVEKANLTYMTNYWKLRETWRNEKRKQRTPKVESVSPIESLGIVPCNVSDGKDYEGDVPESAKA
jgi:hypothetical protein